MTGKSKFKSFCTLAICLAFLTSLAVFISSQPVSAGAPRVVGNPVLVEGANLIAGGESHSLALRGDGTVWAWGYNGQGQLGDNTTADRHTPVRVLGLENAVAIAAGRFHSLALRGDGTVWAWGYNYYGQLGDNTTADRHTPVRVLEMENVVAIAGGGYHSLALRADGTVWAWGWNNYGQLGDGTTTTDPTKTPVKVSDLHRTSPAHATTSAASTIGDTSATLNGELTTIPPDLIAGAGGYAHSLALRGDGTVWAWGHNVSGQLGDNTIIGKDTPVSVLVLENAVAVAAGDYHSLALRADGTVWAWGYNYFGQLGDNTAPNDKHIPVKVLGIENAVAVTAGGYHSLALRGDGTVWAWGSNSSGQLGDNTTTDENTPVRVLGIENVVAVAGGRFHSLALRGDGTVWAWGYNIAGQLGDNTTSDKKIPVRVLGLENAVAVAAGVSHSLALRGDGTVWAWGANEHGQLGDNTTSDRWTPVRVLGMDNAVAIAAGCDHSLALRADGTVWAWGWNLSGQLGDNTTTNRHVPVKTSDLPISCQAWFEWGETTGYGNSTTKQEKTAVGSFSAGLSGLTYWTTYHFRAVVQNSGGTNYGDDENFKTTENIPPDAPLDLSATPSDWTNTNSFTVSWTNPLENSGVVGAYYKLDSVPTSDNDGTLENGPGITSISGVSVSEDGTHTVYVWLKDNAGNADHNNSSSISLKLDTSSPANPQVTSSTHTEGASACNPSPSFSWAPVGGPSPVTFYYKLEGHDDDWQSTSGTGESYAGLRDGPYTFEVYAVDTGGTGGIDSYTFKVDTSAPSIQLSGTATGMGATATAGGWQLTTSDFTLTLSMTVSDISNVTVYVNGQTVPVVGGSFSKVLTLSGGTNNFTIMVVDSAGNSTTRTLAVTQTVPAPPVAPPAGPAPEMLFVVVVIVLIISGAAVIFVFMKPPEK